MLTGHIELKAGSRTSAVLDNYLMIFEDLKIKGGCPTIFLKSKYLMKNTPTAFGFKVSEQV